MKSILTIIICLVASLNLSAQSFLGKWEQPAHQEKFGIKVDVIETLDFLEGGDFDDEVIMMMEVADNKDKMNHLKWKITSRGRWTLDGEVITETFDPQTIRIQLLDKPGSFPGFLVSILDKIVLSEFKRQTRKPVCYQIMSVTESSLKLKPLGPDEDPALGSYTRKN